MARPRTVTTFILLVLLIAVLHLTRLGQSVQKWQLLADLLPFSPLYLALNGFFWSAAALALAWSWWKAHSWGRSAAVAMVSLYSIDVWIERLFLAGNAGRNANWPFAAVVNLAVLAWLFWQLRSAALKSYFGDMDDPRV